MYVATQSNSVRTPVTLRTLKFAGRHRTSPLLNDYPFSIPLVSTSSIPGPYIHWLKREAHPQTSSYQEPYQNSLVSFSASSADHKIPGPGAVRRMLITPSQFGCECSISSRRYAEGLRSSPAAYSIMQNRIQTHHTCYHAFQGYETLVYRLVRYRYSGQYHHSIPRLLRKQRSASALSRLVQNGEVGAKMRRTATNFPLPTPHVKAFNSPRRFTIQRKPHISIRRDESTAHGNSSYTKEKIRERQNSRLSHPRISNHEPLDPSKTRQVP